MQTAQINRGLQSERLDYKSNRSVLFLLLLDTMSRSGKENYDVFGRERVLEYELRLLPDDECIIFVRGENPIRDKKWFPFL